MEIRRSLGCLLIVFAGLLACSQTVALFHMTSPQFAEWDFAKRYALSSGIRSYGLAIAAFTTGILVFRSSARGVAWGALVVALCGLWILVGKELWLHFVELPQRRPAFRDTHPYFTGTYWMFTPRFLWHLVLPVAAWLAAIHVLRITRKRDA
jgi:hypothetical protein